MAEIKDKRTKRSLANILDYKDTFATEKGKKVLWDLMKQSGMLTRSFVEGDSHGTAYNEGARSLCLYILDKINIDIIKLEEQIKQGEKQDAQNWHDDQDGTSD